MTAADKLRELLATRPAFPGTAELSRWWQTSGELVRELLDENAALQAKYGWNPDDGDGVMVAKKILTSGRMTGEDVGRICRAHLERQLDPSERTGLTSFLAQLDEDTLYAQGDHPSPSDAAVSAMRKALR